MAAARTVGRHSHDFGSRVWWYSYITYHEETRKMSYKGASLFSSLSSWSYEYPSISVFEEIAVRQVGDNARPFCLHVMLNSSRKDLAAIKLPKCETGRILGCLRAWCGATQDGLPERLPALTYDVPCSSSKENSWSIWPNLPRRYLRWVRFVGAWCDVFMLRILRTLRFRRLWLVSSLKFWRVSLLEIVWYG